jgi:small conductance mechanosensitive channel
MITPFSKEFSDMETISVVLQELLVKFLQFLPKAIISMVIFLVSLYLAGVLTKIVRLALDRRKTDQVVKMVLVKITSWSVIILGIFIALQQIGFDLSAFLVSLGVVGFTIGFALQDISKNFVAGLLILLQQPFEIGSVIEVDKYLGTVLNVDLRATEIQTLDGKIVLIPNADVYTRAITNYSRLPKRRLDLSIGVAYGSDLEMVKATVFEVFSRISGILTDPAPQAIFNNFGASSIELMLFFWVNGDDLGLLDAKDAAIVALNQAFEERGIEIPYPTHTVLMKQ